jgi:hypothetical protein
MANEPSGGVHNVLPYQTIGNDSWHAHEGKMSIVSGIIPSLANNATAHLMCMTNGDELHFNHIINSNGPAYVYFYEDPVFTTTGARLTQSNINRNFTTSANAVFYANPSVGAITSATLLWEAYVVGDTGGSGKGEHTLGGGLKTGFHWILNKNKNYLLKIHNTAGTEIMIFAEAQYCTDGD